MTSTSSGYSMNPVPLHAAGSKIVGLAADASAAGSDFRSALVGSADPARHRPLVKALDDYTDDWVGPSKALVTRVRALGEDVKAVAVRGQTTDEIAANQQSAAQQAAATVGRLVHRDINAKPR